MARLQDYARHTNWALEKHRKFWALLEGTLTQQQRELINGNGAARVLWTGPEPPEPPGTMPKFFDRQVSALRPLLQFIYKHEGSYDSYNRGVAGDSPGPWPGGLQTLRIQDVMELQRQGRLRAVGAAQFIPSTLPIAVRDAGLSPSNLFSAQNQDRMAAALMLRTKRPRLADYLLGRSDDLAAAWHDLSYEWASMPGPDGRGKWDGDEAGNRATAQVQQVGRLLQEARAALASLS